MDEPQLPDDRSDSTAVAEDLRVRRRAIPKCARCRNHNVITPIKGHKRFCPYTDCTCYRCRFTTDRQRIMARQTAIRRAQVQDRQREEAAPPGPSMSRSAPPAPEAEVEPVIVRPWCSPIPVPLVRKSADAASDHTTS